MCLCLCYLASKVTKVRLAMARFRGAIALANRLSLDRFSQFLERIILKLILQEQAFSDGEEKKLQQVFGLSAEELQQLIDSCCYTYEKAAAESCSADGLADLLKKAGVVGDRLAAFQQVWIAHGTDLMRACKERSFGAPGCSHIKDVQWRLHLKIADSVEGLVLEPTGLLQLQLAAPAKDNETKSLALEFSYDDLFDFYEKLETIQEQLDSLS